jgi:c-di-GMP-binding flagellar brake protein YcgR
MPESTTSLDALVGSLVRVRPAAKLYERREDSTGKTAPALAEAVVEAVTGKAMRLSSDNRQILDLQDQLVVVERPGSSALIRASGTLEALSTEAPYVVIIRLVSPLDPVELVQRREWVRVKTRIDVVVQVEGASDAPPTRMGAITEDLSGGGVRLSHATGLRTGERVQVELMLPRGSVTLNAEVVHATGSGVARLKFHSAPEGALRQITRHVFDTQMELRRQARARPPT